jgi:transcriptional repressor NrdR
MKCPYCDNIDTKVIDSRPTEEGHAIRRRRGCDACGRRFTTYEKVEESILMVIKSDGKRREAFDRNKLFRGIARSCEKRPVSVETMERMVNDVERELNNLMVKEVESSYIGELVMDQLKKVDEVAYIRFASVYRQFTDVNTFITEIEKLVGKSLLFIPSSYSLVLLLINSLISIVFHLSYLVSGSLVEIKLYSFSF